MSEQPPYDSPGNPPSTSLPDVMQNVMLPDVSAMVPSHSAAGGAVCVSPDGEIEELTPEEALRFIGQNSVMLVHADFTLKRIARSRPIRETGVPFFDLTELFAFVYPAMPCLPTVNGLIEAIGLPVQDNAEDQALILYEAAARLLTTLTSPNYPKRPFAIRTAIRMAKGGWPWGPAVMAALGASPHQEEKSSPLRGFDIWNELPEWEERGLRPPASALPVEEEEARNQLALLTAKDAEQRAGQADYTGIASHAFAPRNAADAPNIIIAEAGTGIGKTIGYIAPAGIWATRNKGTVWLSTYTKNLQRQLDQELSRLYPDPATKADKTVIRKGRENYLCLLNFEEMAGRAAMGGNSTAIGLVTRWAVHSRDGDMIGGDFPAWLAARMGGTGRTGLTDRRGECIYTACPHYNKCFIERAIRKARRADIVVANHALVMRQAALDHAEAGLGKNLSSPATGSKEESGTGRENLTRLVFDEGHHIFDAADSAFAATISGIEAAELRRWIRGTEGQRGRRGRGLEERVRDLIAGDEEAEKSLAAALAAAHALPSAGFMSRLQENTPRGAGEKFLSFVRQQVLARSQESDNPFSIEAETSPLLPELEPAAAAFNKKLAEIVTPLNQIIDRLRIKLDKEADDLDTATRTRIEAAIRGIERRSRILLPSWRNMLVSLGVSSPAEFIDWFSVERIGGRDVDTAMHRRWRDPTIPFASAVLEPAHGVLITSATLRDPLPDAPEDDEAWQMAEIRTGASHLALPARRAFMPSPFDYEKQVKIFVVRDVSRTDMNQIAAAYRELFRAARGGALGLFTAIHRLRSVHERIFSPLEEAGLSLYAQHVDALDTSSLVDIFRAEHNACLLGTDAIRDGVDVPGDSLRMIVFDRVPWPRPDILHKARREQFGKGRYDDMLTRLKLKQAFGRLIRRASDRGVFIMLDNRLPTRLTSAFPPGVEIHRIGLAEAIAQSRQFLHGDTGDLAEAETAP